MNLEQCRNAGCQVLPGNSMSNFTTFRLGGPCRRLISCRTEAQLFLAVETVARTGERCVLIGGGSNLLVSDEGLDSVVIRYCGGDPSPRREGSCIEVSGSVSLDELSLWAASSGLSGLEFAAGIPGTVGGAIAGNAGAFGRQIGDVIDSALLVDMRGRTHRATRSWLEFGYRSSRLQSECHAAASVRLRLQPGDPTELLRERERILSERREKHPDPRVVRTAGSFFRNVEASSAAERRQAAGWFLEQAGAKSMTRGGARVFEKHANMIVAEGDCTAQDVMDLSIHMAAAVERKFAVRLVPEVRALGRFRLESRSDRLSSDR